MSREINFLSDRHKQIVKQEVADQRVMLFCGIGLGVCFALFVAVSAVQFYFSYKIEQTKTQEAALRQQVIGNQDTEQSFVVFVRKLSSLVQIDQDRQDKKAIIQFFNSYFGNTITITGVTFDQKAKLVTLQLQSKSVFDLKDVISKLNSDDVASKFNSVEPSNLSRTSDGKYQIDVTVSTVSPKI